MAPRKPAAQKKVTASGKKTKGKSTARKNQKSRRGQPLKKLIIVESPSKAATIKKYLGGGYEVMASVGHLIDLPKSRIGVNLETFEPDYIVMRDKYRVMKELREAAKYASEIILASDPDREGEAIAWHIRNDLEKNVLAKIPDRTVPIRRVKFNEITKKEIEVQIGNPTPIDDQLVNAQQGRRVIDRIFGYQLSPLLWKKVKSKLSAGRVQSVALRLVCEREEAIDRFRPVEYWEIECDLKLDKVKLTAGLTRIDGKKAEVGNGRDASRIEKELTEGKFRMKELKSRNVARNPYPPLITSTLQQSANNLYGFPSMKTMMIAQELYEGIAIGSGRTGLITYMRTDSTRISPQAIGEVRSFIEQKFGADYLPEKPNFYSNKKNSQDAHEAIRPANVTMHPDDIKQYLSAEQYKIYSLIWKRFVASQMKSAQTLQESLEIENGRYTLAASATRVLFEGFQKVLEPSGKKEKELPHSLKPGDVLLLEPPVRKEQKFTEPPSRYNDASLVKEMEELNIGRPSTYAPTIFTLTKRFYVKKEGRSLVPTVLGKAVNKLLVENFPELVNVKFTAGMEEELDEIEEGQKTWKEAVKDFYGEFDAVLKKAYDNIDSIKGSFDEKTDLVCEKCGKPMLKKLGKFGLFLACSGWPECRNTMPLPLGKCPLCGTGHVVQKRGGPRGRVFFGCSRYPECDFASYQKPAEENGQPVNCPVCGSALFVEKGKGGSRFTCKKEGCSYDGHKD